MNITEKREKLFKDKRILCEFCRKVLTPAEIPEVDYIVTLDKETLYFHRDCFRSGQRAALAGMKEGAAAK